MNTTTHLDFLRHGEPVGGRKYRGQNDDPLTELGWAEMRLATSGKRPWTAIVASPLSRCRAYAEELAGSQGLPLSFDERLKEVGFGAWEGQAHADLVRDDTDIVFRFKRDPIGQRPAGAEPLQAFQRRVMAAYEAVLAAHRGGHVLLVCHAGVIRMAISHALQLPPQHVYRLHVASAARARIRIEERGAARLDTLMHLTPGPGLNDA